MEGLGIIRELDPAALLEERDQNRHQRLGYLKRIGAIHGIKRKTPEVDFDESFDLLRKKLNRTIGITSQLPSR